MTAVTDYFEIYKSLPATTKSKVFSMIIKEETSLLSEIEQNLMDSKLIKKV